VKEYTTPIVAVAHCGFSISIVGNFISPSYCQPGLPYWCTWVTYTPQWQCWFPSTSSSLHNLIAKDPTFLPPILNPHYFVIKMMVEDNRFLSLQEQFEDEEEEMVDASDQPQEGWEDVPLVDTSAGSVLQPPFGSTTSGAITSKYLRPVCKKKKPLKGEIFNQGDVVYRSDAKQTGGCLS